MKTTVLLFLLSLCSFAGSAQIEMKESREWTKIGQVKFGGITKASMQYVVDSPNDTSFMFFIKDVREQPKDNYFAIHFKGYNNTFNTFYTVLKSFFTKENQKDRKYEKVFKIGDTNVHVQHHTLLTGAAIMLTTKEGYAYFSERNIDKLFGKR